MCKPPATHQRDTDRNGGAGRGPDSADGHRRAVDGTLQRAIAKLTHHDKRVWCAYLTPSEIVAVVEAGARPSDARYVERARECMATGASAPTWFYCTPAGQVKALLGRRFQHARGH